MKNNLVALPIKEVIIVEGKTDTQKLQKIFGSNLETIETHGLSLDSSTINLIQKINQQQGVIVFTDPDGPGKRIREILNQNLPGKVKNAFISKEAISKTQKKIGIAEASEQAIIEALQHLITFKKSQASLTWNDYVLNDFYLKQNRLKLCHYYHFDEKISSKTLFKWLNLMGLTKNQIQTILTPKKEQDGFN